MQRTPINRSSQARAASQLRNRPSSSMAQHQSLDDDDKEGMEEAEMDVPKTSRRRRQTSSGPINIPQDNVADTLNVIHTQMDEMRGLI